MSILNAIKKVPESLAAISRPVALAIGLTAASASLAQAATEIYAFTKNACYRTTIVLGRDKPYNFNVGNVRINGKIDEATGKRSWNDAFNVVGNVAAAYYTQGRPYGVTATYAKMEGCDGSWAPYCGTVTATDKHGSLPANYQQLIDSRSCDYNWTTKGMFNDIVKGSRQQQTREKAPVPVPANQSRTVRSGSSSGRVEQSCEVDKKGCVHIDLKFDF